MAAISNPDNFRTNVKVLLGEILEKEKYGDNLEKGIYNYTLETCTKMNIIKKWSNKYFVEIYKTKLRTIYNNLKTDSIKDLIIKKIIKPHKLAFMSHQEMLPEKWKELEEDIKIKRQNKYVPVVEASTDSYECRKCRDIENKQAKIAKDFLGIVLMINFNGRPDESHLPKQNINEKCRITNSVTIIPNL